MPRNTAGILTDVLITLVISGTLVCETGTLKQRSCCRKKKYAVKTCTVKDIYSIIDADIHRIIGGPEAENCTYHPEPIPSTWTEAMGGVYTYSGNTITVAGGCRAVFNITFDVCVNGNCHFVLIFLNISIFW